MQNNLKFETFLFLSPKKFIISVKKNSSFESIYEENQIIENDTNEINLSLLDNFLNQHIFKIEKSLNNFIENIILIIDFDYFFPLQISIKNNNYGKFIDKKSITNMLNLAKNQSFETLKEKKIIHILIDNYQINKKNYPDLPENIICDYISIDISFISIDNFFLKSLENVITKYQISLNKIISAKYIKSLFPEQDLNLFRTAKLVIDGYNKNEVEIMTKVSKNKGFFEKFFHFFN